MKLRAVSSSAALSSVLLLFICPLLIDAASSVTYLEPGSHSHVLPEIGSFGYTVERMNVYCYGGKDKSLSQLLQSIRLNIDIDSDDFTCFDGFTSEEVEQAHKSHKSYFSFFNFLSRSKQRVLKLNPFNQTCIGIQTAEEYQVTLSMISVDISKLSLLVGGLILFLFAPKLSSNQAFYYLCGISIGNCASVLVLVWFISKLIPKKPLMYGVLASGWTLAAYFGRIIYENIQPILFSYQRHVLVYLLVTSVVSFAVCYYKGPPKNNRIKDLLKWSLQLIGLVMIFFSSDFKEATIAIIVTSIALFYFPWNIFGGVRRYWLRKFPPKRKLLSKEEFEEQGRIETEKALKDLREYVKSPKCKDQWKIVMNLSQPTRFAGFVEGEQHVTLDETVQYDNTLADDLSSDDDEDSDSDGNEESIAVDENMRPINKSRIQQLQNGSRARNIFNRSANVTSSTPNGRLRTRAQAQNQNSRTTANNTFEMSEDDD